MRIAELSDQSSSWEHNVNSVDAERLLNVTQLSIPVEIYSWLDLRSIFSRKEEIDVMDSYLPYIASMHLAKKSPYSAVNCPNLHYFIHMTAAFIGQQRSIKARMLNDANTVNAMFNASVFAYARCNRIGWGHQFRLEKSANILKRVRPKFQRTIYRPT